MSFRARIVCMTGPLRRADSGSGDLPDGLPRSRGTRGPGPFGRPRSSDGAGYRDPCRHPTINSNCPFSLRDAHRKLMCPSRHAGGSVHDAGAYVLPEYPTRLSSASEYQTRRSAGLNALFRTARQRRVNGTGTLPRCYQRIDQGILVVAAQDVIVKAR